MIHYPGFFSLILQIFTLARSLLSFSTVTIPDLKQYYLQNNPKAKGDRTLCDDLKSELSTPRSMAMVWDYGFDSS
jgi:hypothetical protein